MIFLTDGANDDFDINATQNVGGIIEEIEKTDNWSTKPQGFNQAFPISIYNNVWSKLKESIIC